MPKIVSIRPANFDSPEQETAPPDRAARLEALRVDRSFIVEAPAGSGKTGLLVQRFLKLLADESVERPEQVLAITFTVKATAEMRDRVLGHLENARSNSEPASEFDRQTFVLARAVLERDRQLDWALLDQPNRLQIRTIDSVCSEIARSLPVLSGSGGDLSPAKDSRPLYHDAARRTLLLLGTPQSDPIFDAALSDLLLHRDGNLADCESLIADMLERRYQWGTLIPLAAHQLDDAWLDANVLPRLQHALEQAICSALTQVEAAFPPDILAELADIGGHLGHAAPYKTSSPSRIAGCAGIHTSPRATAECLQQWSGLIYLLMTKGGELRKERGLTASNLKFDYDRKHNHHSRLARVLDALQAQAGLIPVLEKVSKLPSAVYPDDQWVVAKSLFRILSRALIQLQLVFAERSECDFTEITLLARAALTAESGPEDLASALGARLQHLLVDEMQDTSAGQYELLHLLTASWDGHSQTVFLVGDPRQSIYLFRQARVESFLQTIETLRLGDIPLTRLQLTANFRSQRNLVAHFNRDFGLVFPEDSPAASLPYFPADSVQPPSAYAAGLTWHINPIQSRPAVPPSPQSLPTPAQLRQRQAKQDAVTMRQIVERWSQMPLPPGRSKPWQIAVLVRNRNHLIEITSEFDKQCPSPIPYRAVDIVPLSDRQEVLDLTALTRTLLHPADRVAALAVLRAPWCGLSLADLHTLTGADDPTLRKLSIRRLIDQRGDLLPEASIERLKHVWTVLELAAAQDARLSTARLVERVWRSLGGDAWLTQPELSNARRFFSLLDQLEVEAASSGGAIDPARIADQLPHLWAEPAACPPHLPSVELLTIHRAKGLEWDIVLVPALERGPGPNPPRLLTWSELEDASDTTSGAPILMAPIAAKGEEVDTLTSWIKNIHKRRETAEHKRLFYVATTRAREEVHLFAAPDLPARGDLKPRPDSLLKCAWPAAQPHFIEWERGRTGIVTLAPPRADNAQQFPHAPSESIIMDMAATAAPVLRPPLQRLPLEFDPRNRLSNGNPRLSYGEPGRDAEVATLFLRPEGSFAARSFGNVIHACLDMFARRIHHGSPASALLAELPSWAPRITAMFRSDGLPRTVVQKLTQQTLAALNTVLRDPDGLWLLSASAKAASEHAVVAWQDAHDTTPASIRIDRIFHAGPEPHTPGEDVLWIVDYKTANHGTKGLEEFLNSQRATYGPQLANYARILAPIRSVPLEQVRLALYFPALPRLVWWKSTEAAPAISE